MKIRTKIAPASLMALGLLVSAAPVLVSPETDAETMVRHGCSVLMAPSASHAAVQEALIEILDASVLILPKTDHAEEFRSLIGDAKMEFTGKSLFTDKGYQDLSLAYRLVADGKAWQFPEELGAFPRQQNFIQETKRVGQKLIDSALAEQKAGRNEASVRYLLEFVLMVITPVTA
jgi:hypothetical protein